MAKKKIGYQPLDNAYTREIDAWFIVLMTLFIFPVGLWLMWTRTSWKKPVKIVYTVVVILLFISNAMGVWGNTAWPIENGAETTLAA